MVRREQLINKLRELGYEYKDRGKRTTIWRRKGTTEYAAIPLSDFVSDEDVKRVLLYAGITSEEILRFIGMCGS